jgi:predicted PurR-regulated permease PerM
MHEKNQMTISLGTIIKFFLVAILIALLYYLSDVLLVVIAAVVIASAIEPVVRRLKNRLKFHRVVSVILIYLLIIAVIAAVFVFVLPVVVNDASDFLSNIPKTLSLNTLWDPIQNIEKVIKPVSDQISTNSLSLADFMNGIKNTLADASGGALKLATTIFGGAMSLVLIVVLSFYLAVQEDGVGNFLRIITPVRNHEYIIGLWKRSQRKIGFWLQGQVLLGLIMGALVYCVLTIVGVKYALVLALFAGALEIIPVFGPIISAVPAILIAFADGGVSKGVLLVLLYVVINQFENHLFYPLVTKKIVGISPIIVILALVIGAKLAGILGAILAVPLSAALMEYVDDIEKRKKGEGINLWNGALNQK